MAKVGMVSLGCSKNQVDAELLLARLKNGGFEICNDAEKCDAVIINTCGFIEDAKRESIESILEFCDLKETGNIKAVIVTGCLAERYLGDIAEEIPEADAVIGIGRNGDIVSIVSDALEGKKNVLSGQKIDLPLEGERILANAPYFAYLKVADGCDNCCSYCAIPLIRGKFRSRPMENIIEEAKALVSAGVTELNVVAQDTTRYGEDRYGEFMLPELLTELCKIEGAKWIRILYCYPDHITDELLDVMAKEEKIVKYMDIPIQHANGRLLSLMNRHGDSEKLLALMKKIRARMPDIAIRSTVIAGLPTETQDDFEELIHFIRAVRFERLGCFPYSPEEDTPAAAMDGQVDDEIKQRRTQIVMEEQYKIAKELGAAMIGQVLTVLVEGRSERHYFGRSYMDAPDIDTRIYFKAKHRHVPGDYVKVLIGDVDEYDLVGRALEDEYPK